MRQCYKQFKDKCMAAKMDPCFVAYLWATHREADWNTDYVSKLGFEAWIAIKHRSFQKKNPGIWPMGDTYDKAFMEWLDYRCVEERRTK